MRVKAIEQYWDTQLRRTVFANEILEGLSDERFEQLISVGYAVKIEDEKEQQEYYGKTKRNRGVDEWTNGQ